ncbi:hypothetical protein GGR57DRAFT_72958 [Xylariaceae sp. FL1272]|nr:hypothetical protein GGR57DRAFT_72958 [Xylariaceae sp. FL1272]
MQLYSISQSGIIRIARTAISMSNLDDISSLLALITLWFASCYARYQNLKAGEEERKAIMVSLQSSFYDATRIPRIMFPGNPVATTEFKDVVTELNRVEREANDIMYDVLKRSGDPDTLCWFGVFALLWSAVTQLLGSNVSWRWYRKRGEVLELMGKREVLKSRQHFYMLLALNMKQDKARGSLEHVFEELLLLNGRVQRLARNLERLEERTGWMSQWGRSPDLEEHQRRHSLDETLIPSTGESRVED